MRRVKRVRLKERLRERGTNEGKCEARNWMFLHAIYTSSRYWTSPDIFGQVNFLCTTGQVPKKVNVKPCFPNVKTYKGS